MLRLTLVRILGLAVLSLALVVLIGYVVPGRSHAANTHFVAKSCADSIPFRAGTNGYHTFRIPAIVQSGKGNLIAFAEGRHNSSSDTGHIDVVAKHSSDSGCTWGPLQVVTSCGSNTCGNPTPVVDPATNRIVLLTLRNAGGVTEKQIRRGDVTSEQSRRVFVQYSNDHGHTWTSPREITHAVKQDTWRWYATGPGHAIVLRQGPHAGRIVVPANHSQAPPPGSNDTGEEAKYYGAHSLYSDDHGATWHIGFIDDTYDGRINTNETTVAELPEGRLYFNSRDQSGSVASTRADAYSSDGGRTLKHPYKAQTGLVCPEVEGSVIYYRRGSDKDGQLLFSAPAGSSRTHMTIRRSLDGGTSWRTVLTVSNQPAAYSDLVQVGSSVGLLYETGTTGPYEMIRFVRFEGL